MKRFENVKPKWYVGVAALLATIVFFIFVAAPLQVHLGMWGYALTQLGILLIALIPVFLFKWKMSDVMPIKKVTLKQFSAMLLLMAATFIIANTISIVTSYFFPASAELGADMTDFFATAPFIASLIIISVVTGICEEVLHRGVIQHTIKGNKSDLAVMLLMAVFFGIFHLSPFRFLPTAVLGFALTYIMLKTGNFLLPVLYHAIHNGIGFILGYGADTTQAAVIPLESVGLFVMLSSLSPLLIYAGVRLLNKEKPKKKIKYAAIILTVLLPVLGVGIMALPHTPAWIARRPLIFNIDTAWEDIRLEPRRMDFAFNVENTETIHVMFSAEGQGFVTVVSFYNERGELEFSQTDEKIDRREGFWIGGPDNVVHTLSLTFLMDIEEVEKHFPNIRYSNPDFIEYARGVFAYTSDDYAFTFFIEIR